MSHDIWSSKDGAVSVSGYAGPEPGAERPRRRVQITVVSDLDGRHHAASLTLAEFRALISACRNY